jgi:hypothetical protein
LFNKGSSLVPDGKISSIEASLRQVIHAK